MWVHAPTHMPKTNGYCLDRCIAEEIMILWQLGIITTGCCCGHGTHQPFIGVAFEHVPQMKALGYSVQFNSCRPGDEDTFTPMGTEYAIALLHSKLGIACAR